MDEVAPQSTNWRDIQIFQAYLEEPVGGKKVSVFSAPLPPDRSPCSIQFRPLQETPEKTHSRTLLLMSTLVKYLLIRWRQNFRRPRSPEQYRQHRVSEGSSGMRGLKCV
jgi:hypothetical protein